MKYSTFSQDESSMPCRSSSKFLRLKKTDPCTTSDIHVCNVTSDEFSLFHFIYIPKSLIMVIIHASWLQV